MKILIAYIYSSADGNGSLLFGVGDEETGKEFRDCPLNREAFKYNKLMSFVYRKKEYCVGDVVKFVDDKIGKIHSLYYKPIDGNPVASNAVDCHPPLLIHANILLLDPNENVNGEEKELTTYMYTEVLEKVALPNYHPNSPNLTFDEIQKGLDSKYYINI